MGTSARRRTVGASALALTVGAGLGLALGTGTADAVPRTAVTGPTTHRAVVARAALRAVAGHARALRAGAGQRFTVTGVLVDPDGTRHVRMTRTYRGLPVLGGDVVVHQGASGAWRGRSQTLTRTLTLSAQPRLAPRTATARATAPSRLDRSVTGRSVIRTRLVVDATGATPRLAYEVLTGGTQRDGTPSRLATYVDARTGRLVRAEQQIETVGGKGRTLYSGTVPLDVRKSGSTYQLRNPTGTRGGTYTTDMKNTEDSMVCQVFGTGCKAGTQITSASTTFGSGGNSNRASAGADAQYGSNLTWDYYKSRYGRNGIFGTGKGSYNRVHYGQGYVNAFWDGTKMTYGDGDGQSYGPLTSIDVAGHEMSHGVTENSAGLTYSGESGGLNEATSDIFGTAVEFYADNPQDVPDYLIGEQFDLVNHTGFRRMDKPSSDGSSADCWSKTVGSLDVHYSSGVGNHLFYLLSEGSGAKTLNGVRYSSPTCNGAKVTGIGHVAAEAVWYRALTVYMTSGTDYHGARTATLKAAADLYGAGSTQAKAVDAAWAAVNVTP